MSEDTNINDTNVIHLVERKRDYTAPLMYALASVESMDEIPKYNPTKRPLTVAEKVNIASQIAGITNESAIKFCAVMKELSEE